MQESLIKHDCFQKTACVCFSQQHPVCPGNSQALPGTSLTLTAWQLAAHPLFALRSRFHDVSIIQSSKVPFFPLNSVSIGLCNFRVNSCNVFARSLVLGSRRGGKKLIAVFARTHLAGETAGRAHLPPRLAFPSGKLYAKSFLAKFELSASSWMAPKRPRFEQGGNNVKLQNVRLGVKDQCSLWIFLHRSMWVSSGSSYKCKENVVDCICDCITWLQWCYGLPCFYWVFYYKAK